jgi:hypothetical protein
MTISKSARFGGAVALGAVSVVALFAASETALAKRSSAALVGRIETPLGLQGTRGAGANVGVIFNLIDESRRKSDVEVQYGIDINADGDITEDEFRPATEDRFDSRDTRKNKLPQLFSTAGDIGAAQQYVWKSLADIGTARALTLEYALTAQGRQVPDPDNPGSFLFASGPSGNQVFAGVKVRVRAVRRVGRQKIYGDWVVSESFGVNNNNPPVMTINSIDNNGISNPTASDETVMIHWTAFDADSEDLNGNGQLDIAAGEDVNNNGILDCENVGVAFDYHRLLPTENPGSMTPAQIAALSWLPCTRTKGVGDTDSLDARPGVPIPTTGDLAGVCSAPPGVGRNWTFAWDSVTDVGTVYAKFVFRARPFDQKRENGNYAYFSTATQLDNRAIFKADSIPFPIAGLTSGRVGHTVTQVISSLNSSDVEDRGEPLGLLGFQNVLVAGGATSINGAGVSNMDLMTINTASAETTTSDRVTMSLLSARAYHTATALDDGRILIVGGFGAAGTPLASTEVYDPKTRTSVAGPNLSTARAKHAAVKLASGDVAILGGISDGGAVTNTCEIVNFRQFADKVGDPIAPSSWTVSALPSLATAQHSLSAVLLPDQTVLVTGGITGGGTGVTAAQLLDPIHDDDQSTPSTKNPVFIPVTSSLSVAREFGSATALIDGNVLFAGGSSGNAGGPTKSEPRGSVAATNPANASMEIFNWQTRAFEPVDLAMQVVRAQHLAVLLGDGTVLLAGGTSDPGVASPPVAGDADIVKIGARNAVTGHWAATLQQVNGDLIKARRLARAAAIDNGRVMIYGGSDATTALSATETFTPLAGSNSSPKARTALPSSEQSWLFGAPIYYRLTDADSGDRARVVVQFIDRTPTGSGNWRQCSPQPDTIGGDVAETTANLVTVLTDDQSLVIDPVAKNTLGDHAYIWAMQRDIVRPAPGTKSQSYNIRVIPSGAVVGTLGESSPIDVLYNTKVLPTILPFENLTDNRPDDGRTANNGTPTNNLPAGTLTPNQGGDIRIWVHLRDLDGGVGNNGDTASCLYEYAVDTNGDGQISDQTSPPEFFRACTASGAASNHPASTNPQTGLKTYYYAAFPNAATNDPGSDPAFGARPAAKGWTFFDWDSIRDVGTPLTSFTNVWIRVTPSDASSGFSRIVRNTANSTVLRIVRHPDSLFLLSWRPRFSNNKNAMPVNDPIDFTFNGQIQASSVTSTGVQVFRGTTTATSQVRGQLSVVNNANNTATVTFFPDPQSLSVGSVVYLQTAASTVLFPSDIYSIRIPGYALSAPGPFPLGDPHTNPSTGPTLRPLAFANATEYRTYLLIQAAPLNTGTQLNDPLYKFTTAAVGVYANDGFSPTAPTTNLPVATTTLLKSGTTSTPASVPPSTALQFSFNRAIDPNTLQSPNITTTLVGNTTGGTRITTSIVPGRWTVTNTPGPNGTSVAVLSFTPLFQLPPTSQLQVAWNSGLKAFNGNSVPAGSFLYNAETYARVTRTLTNIENFSNTNPATNQNDTTVTTAIWGTDGCAAGAISGGSNGLTGIGTPTGASGALNVTSGTTTLTLTTYNYTTLTVAKGATLLLNSQSGQMSILATGDITINGTVDYRGASGSNGAHGGTSYPYVYYSCQYAGTRVGGSGRNGGGNGGSSATSSLSASPYRYAGTDGTAGALSTSSQGQGGLIATETSTSVYSRYLYGAGGGAGGGNGTVGLGGGRAMTQFSALSGYGAASTPGAASSDAFMGSGVNAGGGGGGGGSSVYPGLSQQQGGGGGAGAGGVVFNTNTNFILSATGLINGRGGNGGSSAMGGGSGGGGAGGSLYIVAKGSARLDGVVDLRGGNGGAKGWALGTSENTCVTNAATEKTARYGGDGGNGRLVVLAPNFVAADEVRVFGQLYVKQIATLPTTAIGSSAPPFGLDGSSTTTTINFGGATVVRYTSLTVAASSTIDLRNDTATGGNNPVQIFVDGAVNIAGKLTLNGNSAGTAGPNRYGQITFPNNQSGLYTYPPDTSYGTGMQGNMGGGKGGDGYDLITSVANGTQATNGSGPSPGMHNMKTTSGYYYYWYIMFGDSGGSGGASATEGEDGWASYAIPAAYNYLGAVNDTSGAGNASQSGQTSTAPKRLGTFTTDPTAMVITNLSSFVGSGGGGGNSGYDGNYNFFGYSGIAGAGGGAVGIVSPASVTISGTIEARGGDGQTPGHPQTGWPTNAHAGAGGGSGGTIYIASNSITLSPVTPSTGAGGATIDLRGGAGGGYRGTNLYAGLQAYPEYYSVGSFGGKGGYGMMVLAVTPNGTVNGVTNVNSNLGKPLANRWGMEQTTIDSATNTYKTLAATARFYCPGIQSGGSLARSKWYDLGSIQPVVDAFKMNVVTNATLTTKVEGAQSAPTTAGTAVPPVGVPDAANTSGLFVVPATTGFLKGWRWLRFELSFTKTTSSTGGAVVIDDALITYTGDL